MEWILLMIAGLLETVWMVSMKFSQGFTRFWPSALILVAGGVGYYLLSLAVKVIPVGTAYALLVGVGAATTTLVGIFFLGESRDLLRIMAIGLIIGGVILLRLADV